MILHAGDGFRHLRECLDTALAVREDLLERREPEVDVLLRIEVLQSIANGRDLPEHRLGSAHVRWGRRDVRAILGRPLHTLAPVCDLGDNLSRRTRLR